LRVASSDRVNRDEMSTPVNPSPFPLDVSELHEGARVRVRLRGELDFATADFVADRLRRLRERHAAVLLDLDELAFIDAGGLRVVLTAAADARNDGWAFAVTRGSAPVRRLVELLDLDGQLPVDGASS
jgi:anti-sigma B factor antagonist